MESLTFQDISQQCQRLIDTVNQNRNKSFSSIIKKLYLNFSFNYFSPQISQKEEIIKDFLIKTLKEFKFITLNYSQIPKSLAIILTNNNNLQADAIDVLICAENHVFIINRIKRTLIKEILKETKSYLINTENPPDHSIDDEFTSFNDLFEDEIINNEFINYTIKAVFVYSVRRFYLPSNFFKDPSFFSLEQQTKEQINKDSIINLFQVNNKDEMREKIDTFLKNLKQSQKVSENKNSYKIFNESDFIKLRYIDSNTNSYFYLVMNTKNLHIFMLKETDLPNIKEIKFCKKYHHSSFTKFYGFVKKERKITGFIYEYMCNGTLSSYYESNSEKINEIFSIMTLVRIFNGIQYLQSQNLIHRDLKPSNILLDHDFIPYICDYETIRSINLDPDSEFTKDFVSLLYGSPEQYNSSKTSDNSSDILGDITFQTDIYSFGAITYFLFEKKDMVDILKNEEVTSFYEKLEKGKIPKMEKASKYIENIYTSCVKYKAKDRLSLEGISEIIINEITSFSYLEKYPIDPNYNGITIELVRYFQECLLFVTNAKNTNLFDDFIETIFNIDILSLFLINEKNNKSDILYRIGLLYYDFKYNENDYAKAKEYFELSAKQNNSNALFNLGNLYFFGKGVEKNYFKAREYYELSAKQGNSNALIILGDIYYFGNGVEKDYTKSKEFYELSAQQNNSEALVKLGIIYHEGLCVKQNYSKAKEYYELAAKQNNSNAFLNLGNLYFYGQGVEQNLSKAKEYYELSAEQDNSDALHNIGKLYLFQNGDNHNCLMAKKCFEKSAEKNNSSGYLMLGNLYLNGFQGPPNIVKAIEYFAISAKLNNSEAFLRLGYIYFYGYGIEKYLNIALSYFELSAKLNNSEALFLLGNLYFNGIGVQQNINKAIEYFELASKQNNPIADNVLGNLYFNGIGVQQNYIKSREHYEKSAKQNNIFALLNLENHFINGFGINPYFYQTTEYNELMQRNIDSDVLFNLGFYYHQGKNYSKAQYFLELSAQQNNSKSLLLLGHMNLYIFNNYQKAIDYYQLSADQGNMAALNCLGCIYYDGQFVNQDYHKAKMYFEFLANKNNSIGFLNLGNIYYNGVGFEQDLSKARKYYEKSAQLGNSEALIKLGNLYIIGQGVNRDYKKAIKYLEKSAQQNNSNAIYFLGCIYFNGTGVKIDYKLAIQNFNLAASLNHITAILILGDIYFNGYGVKQDYLKAFQYYNLAANLNNSVGYYTIGLYYFYGTYGIDQDYTKAREYFEKASNLNNIDAMSMLGIIYENGLGIEKEYTKAIKYYEIAAKNGCTCSLLNLGHLYYEGNCAVKDTKRMIYYYELASKLNNSQADLRLYFIYKDGIGVDIDIKKAVGYLEKAASNGSTIAIYCMGDHYNDLKDYKKAKKYYELAAQHSFLESFLNLSDLYYYGHGVKKDYKKAKYYLELAASKKYPNSLYKLAVMYSSGIPFDVDINKAIHFFTECINCPKNQEKVLLDIDSVFLREDNDYYYHSFNDLGLIYLNIKDDLQKAEKYMKIAAFAEFPFGQNSFGLINQFYLFNNENIKYMYDKSSKNNFAIAEYNLGFIFENEGNISESIKYYINASDHEDLPFKFHDIEYTDERLSISQMFVIRFTNLKLTDYFLTNEDYAEAKKYFVRSFSKLIDNNYKFEFHFNSGLLNPFSYLKSFILNNPKFNLINQPNLSEELKKNFKENKSNTSSDDEIDEKFIHDDNEEEDNDDEYKIIKKKKIDHFDFHFNSNNIDGNVDNDDNDDIVFNDPGKLFDFIEKNNCKNEFINEIKEIIQIMHSILYTKPYLILFGRICMEHPRMEVDSIMRDINADFIEGLGKIQ